MNTAPAPAGLLLGTRSQTCAFQSPKRPTWAPGTTPAAQVLPGLVTLLAIPLTSLGQVNGRPSPGCKYLPVLHRLPQDSQKKILRISAYERTSLAYPSGEVVRSLAPSSVLLTDKPLRALEPVELFVFRLFTGYPERSAPAWPIARLRTPQVRHVERTSRALHPNGPLDGGCGHEPRVWDLADHLARARSSPTWRATASQTIKSSGKFFSVARFPHPLLGYRVEHWDWTESILLRALLQ